MRIGIMILHFGINNGSRDARIVKNLAFLRHPTDAGEGAAVGLPALRAVADQNLDLHACLSEAKPR